MGKNWEVWPESMYVESQPGHGSQAKVNDRVIILCLREESTTQPELRGLTSLYVKSMTCKKMSSSVLWERQCSFQAQICAYVSAFSHKSRYMLTLGRETVFEKEECKM